MASRTGFETLPNELIWAIFDLLDPKSLFQLNTANRKLHHLTCEHLYSSFNGHDYSKFLRTLTSSSTHDPSLSQHVKSATCIIEPSKSIFQGITEQNRAKILDTFKALPLPDPELRADILSYYETDGDSIQHHWILDFFLLFLPNLERLVVKDTSQWNEHQYWFTHITGNASYMSHLRSITIHGPCRVRNVLHLFTLPSLRELTLFEVAEISDPTYEWYPPSTHPDIVEKLKANGSNVETLRIKDSYMESTDLDLMLSSIKALKCYEYMHFPPFDLAASEDVNPDLSKLATVLGKHAATLQELIISHEQVPYFQYSFPRITPNSWSPEYDPTFPRLRKLSVGFNVVAQNSGTPSGEYTAAGRRDVAEVVDRFLAQVPGGLEVLDMAILFGSPGQKTHLGSCWVKYVAERGGWAGREVRKMRMWRPPGVRGAEGADEIWGQRYIVKGIFEDVGVEFV